MNLDNKSYFVGLAAGVMLLLAYQNMFPARKKTVWEKISAIWEA